MDLRRWCGERFDYVREIGRGGTSRVHLLTDRQRGTRVALKVLREELASSMSSLRLLREIQILEDLRHPSIVPVLESGDVEGTPCYIMPFVSGGSLRDRLDAEGSLPYDTALRVLDDAASAIDFAHARNVVHRDITPGNLLFEGARTLVCDFGIARAIQAAADEKGMTSSGIVVGTLDYMSPEQWLDCHHVDGRTDIYALGCVAYEILTGEPPFSGATSLAMMARHAADTPPLARLVRPELPQCVDAAISRALAKTPADRPPSAAAFVALLRG